MHAAEKSISDLGDKADPAAKADVESAMADLKTALEGEDQEDLKAKTEALSAAMMKMGEAAYQAEQAAGAADGTATGADDDGVVDAEFEEVNNDDNETKNAG